MIAQQLLRDTSLSVKDITEKVGFVDPFHFSKRFKQCSGLSPAQYRARPKAEMAVIEE